MAQRCVMLPEIGLGLMLVPKVANSAMKHAVLDLLGVEWTGGRMTWHPAIDRRRESPEKARKRGLFIAGFVRNPFDRLVSLWADKVGATPPDVTKMMAAMGIKPDMPFPDFVALVARVKPLDVHVLPQSRIVLPETVDFLGRFETLAEDWARLRERFPALPDLGHHNASRRGPYRDYYDDLTRKLAAKTYRHDLEMFGYDF